MADKSAVDMVMSRMGSISVPEGRKLSPVQVSSFRAPSPTPISALTPLGPGTPKPQLVSPLIQSTPVGSPRLYPVGSPSEQMVQLADGSYGFRSDLGMGPQIRSSPTGLYPSLPPSAGSPLTVLPSQSLAATSLSATTAVGNLTQPTPLLSQTASGSIVQPTLPLSPASSPEIGSYLESLSPTAPTIPVTPVGTLIASVSPVKRPCSPRVGTPLPDVAELKCDVIEQRVDYSSFIVPVTSLPVPSKTQDQKYVAFITRGKEDLIASPTLADMPLLFLQITCNKLSLTESVITVTSPHVATVPQHSNYIYPEVPSECGLDDRPVQQGGWMQKCHFDLSCYETAGMPGAGAGLMLKCPEKYLYMLEKKDRMDEAKALEIDMKRQAQLACLEQMKAKEIASRNAAIKHELKVKACDTAAAQAREACRILELEQLAKCKAEKLECIREKEACVTAKRRIEIERAAKLRMVPCPLSPSQNAELQNAINNYCTKEQELLRKEAHIEGAMKKIAYDLECSKLRYAQLEREKAALLLQIVQFRAAHQKCVVERTGFETKCRDAWAVRRQIRKDIVNSIPFPSGGTTCPSPKFKALISKLKKGSGGKPGCPTNRRIIISSYSKRYGLCLLSSILNFHGIRHSLVISEQTRFEQEANLIAFAKGNTQFLLTTKLPPKGTILQGVTDLDVLDTYDSDIISAWLAVIYKRDCYGDCGALCINYYVTDFPNAEGDMSKSDENAYKAGTAKLHEDDKLYHKLINSARPIILRGDLLVQVEAPQTVVV